MKKQNSSYKCWIKYKTRLIIYGLKLSSVIRIRFYFCRIITYIVIHVFIIYKGEYEATWIYYMIWWMWIFYLFFLSPITANTFTELDCIIWVTRRVSYKKQELLALREHMTSARIISLLCCPIMCLYIRCSVRFYLHLYVEGLMS